ncbi:MAG: hypothetical protein ABW252_24585 [Polyangiales bacterium]
MRGRTLAFLTVCALAACDGTDDPVALDEPIVVRQGDYKKGPLPGVLAAAGVPEVEPRVTSRTLGFGVLRPGTPNAQITGRASASAYAVGVRLKDQGDGYWVRPVGAEDPLLPGELQWQLPFDAASAITPGLHELEIVAFDAKGNPGTKTSLPLCIAADIPDNGNACNPSTQPPQLIATLTWNADSDLDLSAVGPNGVTYGRSKRSLLAGDKVLVRLDGDGVSGCLADGRRSESFVWNEGAPSGTWALYANLFDACQKPSVRFTLTLRQRRQTSPTTYELTVVEEVHGELTRAQANGGAGAPLFLYEFGF